MGGVRVAAVWAVSLGLALAPAVSLADPPTRTALNKEGYWDMEVQGDACMSSMWVDGDIYFMLSGEAGEVGFAVGVPKPLQHGKAAQLQTDVYSFDFVPSYTRGGDVVYTKEHLNARAMAALRLAREVRVVVDGKLIMGVAVENTGFDGVLDALIACSKGERGWWGDGVAVAKAADPPAEPRYNKEDVWSLQVSAPGVCIAQARIDDHAILQFIGADGNVGLGVGTTDGRLPRGGKGLVQTDAYSFAFEPRYETGGYLFSKDWFDSQALFALRRTKGLRVSLDGKPLLDVALETTGFPAILDEVLACSQGGSGWWGDGAPPPR